MSVLTTPFSIMSTTSSNAFTTLVSAVLNATVLSVTKFNTLSFKYFIFCTVAIFWLAVTTLAFAR